MSVFKGKNYEDLFSTLWHGSFDPRFPDLGWGNGDYTIVHDLKGPGLPNLPHEAEGIRLDSNTNSSYRLNRANYYSFIKKEYLKSLKSYRFTIQCYTSPDYDGNQVFLTADLSDSPQKYSGYNLEKKGTWQTLSLNISGDNNIANYYISFFKDSVRSFQP